MTKQPRETDQNNDTVDAALIEAARREVEALEGPARAEAAAPVSPDSFKGYHLLQEVHRGAQGVVYHAIEKFTQREVAIKLLKEGPLASPAERGRFEREVEILTQLKHPHIVAIRESGSAAGSQYFVMDYVYGVPLDAYGEDGRSIEDRGNGMQAFGICAGSLLLQTIRPSVGDFETYSGHTCHKEK